MSDKKCCVPGCASLEGPHVLHGFPNPEKDRERFNIWLMAIGGDIIGLEMYHVYKYRRVCRVHFEARFLCRNNRISNVAVPTLHMPEPSASNIPVLVEDVQVLTACSSSQLPLTSSNLQAKNTRQNLGPISSSTVPVPLEEVQVLPSCSSSQLPVTVEQVQVMPGSSNSQVKISLQNLGGKRASKTRYATLNPKEKALQLKIAAAKIKINKLKSKVRRTHAQLKSAKTL